MAEPSPSVPRRSAPEPRSRKGRQTGVALLLLLLAVVMAGAAVFLANWNPAHWKNSRDLQTDKALREARDALIAYAVSVDLTGGARLGDLPCPDLDNDGRKEISCGNASGSTGQDHRLGRLPWQSLGISDLRDGSGEGLWYAVSSKFKENTRYSPLNSDTPGTLRVKDPTGKVISNVVALVIAPGEPLTRQGAPSIQDRNGLTNQSDAKQYLDTFDGEDNADFVDESATNGFISGPVRDTNGYLVVNDRLLAITVDDLMPIIERRVAAEVLNCLTNYAAHSDNGGRFPWPASLGTSASGSYDDTLGVRFGRVANLMCATGGEGPGDLSCDPVVGTNPAMQQSWGAIAGCSITNSWFTNHWREQVFYAIAEAYKPDTGTPSCGVCLTVDSKTSLRVAVVLARKALAGQDRTGGKDNAANYLEGGNSTPYDDVFQSGAPSATFNDLVVYQ